AAGYCPTLHPGLEHGHPVVAGIDVVGVAVGHAHARLHPLHEAVDEAVVDVGAPGQFFCVVLVLVIHGEPPVVIGGVPGEAGIDADARRVAAVQGDVEVGHVGAQGHCGIQAVGGG